PTLGESVTEATVGKWFKRAGETVKADEPIVELETDKVTLEVNAPAAGVISEVRVKEGETVSVGAVLGAIGEGAGAAPAPAQPAGEKVSQVQSNGAAVRAHAEQGSPNPGLKAEAPSSVAAPSAGRETLSPAVRKAVTENNIDPATVRGTGKDGQ